MGEELPAMQETQLAQGQFPGWEDPLEEVMATHYSILAWKIPWTEEAGVLCPPCPWSRRMSDTTERLSTQHPVI